MESFNRLFLLMPKMLYQWFLCLPHKFHWFFVVVTAFIIPWLTRNTVKPGEWYPFSNFPMYSNFEKQAYYVYITDKNDQPVAMYPTFGNWPSGIKKMYDGKLKEVVNDLKAKANNQGTTYKTKIVNMTSEECRPAGDATLKQLVESSRTQDEIKKHTGFRLYQMDITLNKEGNIVKKTKLVGEL